MGSSGKEPVSSLPLDVSPQAMQGGWGAVITLYSSSG